MKNQTVTSCFAVGMSVLIGLNSAAAEFRRTASPVTDGTVELTVAESILMALENNYELRVQRLNPKIRKTGETLEASALDPVLSGRVGGQRVKSSGGGVSTTNDSAFADVSLNKLFPTGTSVGADVSTRTDDSSFSGQSANTQAGVSINQSLLRGFGTNVNLASLRQARLDTFSSEYELRAFAETLVFQVENAYWNLILAENQVSIVKESLEVAERQLYEIDERIRVGKTAESERAAALAEVALRKESLINAKSSLDQSRLTFLRLVNFDTPDLWNMNLALVEIPAMAPVDLGNAAAHLSLAEEWRPDLRQAELSRQRNELDVVKTKNGLLPRMDLFINLGGTGYSRSFGDTFSGIGGDAYDLQAGLQLEFPLGNRAASARHERSQLSYEQAERSLVNLKQLAQVDVLSAYIEATRSLEQIEATRATRLAQEEKLRSETEKFRVGKSTSLLVAQAQRDLLSSRLEEVQAAVSYRTALIDFYRQEGTLLRQRGISAQFIEPSGLLP